MPEIGTSSSMSGDRKRGVGHRPQPTAPILDSTKASSRGLSFAHRDLWTARVKTDLSKFHQVLCDEHLAGKVLLNFLDMADVIIIQMCQHHRLDIRARRQFSNFVG